MTIGNVIKDEDFHVNLQLGKRFKRIQSNDQVISISKDVGKPELLHVDCGNVGQSFWEKI